jgi:hypothetical protein
LGNLPRSTEFTEIELDSRKRSVLGRPFFVANV